MQFKVGDRVEAIKGPSNTEHDDYVGPGTIVAVRQGNRCDEDVQVDLDMGEKSWWFAEESLRPLKPTPTPSITVGTQVRLTGVVTGKLNEEEEVVWVTANDFSCPIPVGALEVIRQPFKRGEVVYSCGAIAAGERYVVFNDERDGFVDIVHCDSGTAATYNDAKRFERRP
jgi:hypothetical protein